MSTERINIHDELLKAVKKAGNQSRLAERFGVSRAFMSDMVLGRREISPKIANLLGFEMTVEYRRVETIRRNAR